MQRLSLMLLSVFLCVTCLPAGGKAMTVLAEEYRPLSYVVDGEGRGFAVDLFAELERRMGQEPSTVTFMGWTRAYRLLLRGPRHAILFMGKTVEREKMLWFVGPIWTEHDYFYKRTGNPVEVKTFDDARGVKRIGVVRDDYYQLRLQEMGFTNLDVATSNEHGLRKLLQGRVDLVPLGELTAASFLEGYPDLSPEMFERTGCRLFTSEMFIAFSRDVPEEEVAIWQAKLDAMKRDGTYDELLARHVPLKRVR